MNTAETPKPKRKYVRKAKPPVSTIPSRIPPRREVQKVIEAYSGSSHYSGKTRTLHITDKHDRDIETTLIRIYGFSLPFKLMTNG